MFKGIVEELGEVVEIRSGSGGTSIRIRAREVLNGIKVGDSVNVDGVCLTVTGFAKGHFQADVVRQTMTKTTLSKLRRGDKVNLERAVQPDGRFGGHFVTGHVDGVGKIVKRADGLITIQVPEEMMRYVFPRGAVAVDGISLTVVNCHSNNFETAIIPHTACVTSLGLKREGSSVNVETDLIGKQVDNIIRHAGADKGITKKFLSERGFIP